MIDLLTSPEQDQIVDAVITVLDSEFPVARHRDRGASKAGGDRRMLPEMGRLGWFSLAWTEEEGGAGLSIAEEMLLFCELGSRLVSPLCLGAVLGARVAHRAGRTELAASIAAGRQAVAIAQPLAPSEDAALPEGPYYLFDAAAGDRILCWTEGGAWLLDRSAFGEARDVESIDGTLCMECADIRQPVTPASIDARSESIHWRATILIAAMLVGNARATRDMAAEYAKLRQQFGQPIGAFQAIKHACADMAVRVEAAQSQTSFAALVGRSGGSDRLFHAAAARVVATEAALANAAANIQIHGGMGFHEECDAHLFLKRAHVLDQVGGPARRYHPVLMGGMR